MHDVIIIGGSYAGLAAALQLGRARRRVLIIDAGQRRNRVAESAHGFLGQDGVAPADIAAKGRAEVLAYPTVSWLEGFVTEARAEAGHFKLQAGASTHTAKRLILATGVTDTLPDIPGLAEQWGKTVFHCPYCHGYELDHGPLGVLATSPLSLHHAALVAEWGAPGQTTLFLNEAFEPDEEQLAELAAREIQLERARVTAVAGTAHAIELQLEGGRSLPKRGLFLVPRTQVQSALAEQLGCELETGPTGAFFKINAVQETSVPGVFACGDAAVAYHVLARAVADGVMAGAAAHRSLVFPT